MPVGIKRGEGQNKGSAKDGKDKRRYAEVMGLKKNG